MIFEFILIVRNGSNQESKDINLLNVQIRSGASTSPAELDSPKQLDGQGRKIWTRGEFTHHNSGVGGTEDNDDYSRYKSRFKIIIIFFFTI